MMNAKKSSYLPITEINVESRSKVQSEASARIKSSWWHRTGPLVAVLGLLVVAALAGAGRQAALAPTAPDILSATAPDGTPLDASTLFDWAGRYVLRNFDRSTPMANFLPGLGGYWGVPMWTFYVNRGQAVCSMGISNKDGSIAKYNTAEKVYQNVPFNGFRTFLRGTRGKSTFNYMPFFIDQAEPGTRTRDMAVGMTTVEIAEINKKLDLNTTVTYFSITDEDFPALVRKTSFTNMDKSETLELEVLDGLARLEPSGLSNFNLDAMGRTMEAWMNVYNMQDGSNKTQPFYHISQGTADTTQVQIINDGHFVMSFVENDNQEYTLENLLPFVVDPRLVFGTDTTLTDPSGFFNRASSLENFLGGAQATTSRTPCAFAGTKITVPPGATVTVTSVYGHAPNLNTFEQTITPIVLSKNFANQKFVNARSLVFNLTSFVSTKTNNPVFDKYVSQDFLDNVLRGGVPVILGDSPSKKIYHTFSRIHGDLERDYNPFQIDTTYFSQGPGNFRDVNQNRRNDVMHVPAIGDFNLRMFLSFVQADGYNPLTVAGTNFRLNSDDAQAIIADCGIPSDQIDSPAKLLLLLTSPFRIGNLFNLINMQQITIAIDKVEFLNRVMTAAVQVFAAQYAPNQGGFWQDHWTYTMDLLDTYLWVYPDKMHQVLYESVPIPFFMSPAIVNERKVRYSLCPSPENPSKQTICAYNNVCQWGDASGCFPPSRISAMNSIFSNPNFVADNYGAGGVWQQNVHGEPVTVTVMAKFLMLGVLKFSTLDPMGMGVEYEGGKPGWNDAMNGLPGLLGSGMPETFEMLRILNFLNKTLSLDGATINVPTEFSSFLADTGHLLSEFFTTFPSGASETDPNMTQVEFEFWDKSNNIREGYRKSIVANFVGTFASWTPASLLPIIRMMILKTTAGINRAVAMTPAGHTPTYFYYEADSFQTSPNPHPVVPPNVPRPFVFAKSFVVHQVPLFLEGPTRHMKVIQDITHRRDIYHRTKKSSLYDSYLKMFKISSSLKTCVQNIGRMMAFAAGWLENESVWLHMSYKFYLELLRGGLYDEFFSEIKTGLVPFMKPGPYGRSPVEASSFIVSSVFPDESIHGTGFLARLSGSTAEFLSMWAIMMAGHDPFLVDSNGILNLQFRPVLPDWFFREDDNSVSFTFMGHTVVTYHNPERQNTWNLIPKSATLVTEDGIVVHGDAAVFSGFDLVDSVRQQRVKTIDVFF